MSEVSVSVSREGTARPSRRRPGRGGALREEDMPFEAAVDKGSMTWDGDRGPGARLLISAYLLPQVRRFSAKASRF